MLCSIFTGEIFFFPIPIPMDGSNISFNQIAAAIAIALVTALVFRYVENNIDDPRFKRLMGHLFLIFLLIIVIAIGAKLSFNVVSKFLKIV